MGRRATKVWIRKRRTNGGISYSLRWREDGRMRSESLGRVGKERADRMRLKKEYELAFVTAREPVEIGWQEFVEDHLRFSRAKKSEATCVIEERLLRQIGEHLQPAKLTDLTYEKLEAFFTHRRLVDGVSPATLNKQIRTLRSVLARAAKHGYLEDNPAKELGFWDEAEKTNRTLSPAEVEALLAAGPSVEWRAFLYLAVSCGLRVGELCHLRWEDLDLERGILSVRNRSHWQTKGRKNRILGLNERAISLLKKVRSGAKGSPHVFSTRQGNPWRNNIQPTFRRIVKKAGISSCTLHDLRRTFCTEVSKKMPPKVLMELAGHSDIKVTEKYYLAAAQEQQVKEAAQCLPY